MADDFINSHLFLVEGGAFEECSKKVAHFFDKNELVKYDSVEILAHDSFSGNSAVFWAKLDDGLAGNVQQIKKLLNELKDEGYGELEKWHSLPQGYTSKIVHTLSHLLDGFFGVDSVFYNLIDESHQVIELLREKIEKNTDNYWLVKVSCRSFGGEADRVPFLRRTGKE